MVAIRQKEQEARGQQTAAYSDLFDINNIMALLAHRAVAQADQSGVLHGAWLAIHTILITQLQIA